MVRATNFVEQEMDRLDKEGKSRRQRWLEDPTPITVVPRDEVRHLFMGDPETRTVSKNGVRFDNIDYIDPGIELRGFRGRTVKIRYLPNERSFIDVYDTCGEFICTAVPTDRLDAEARGKLRRVRNNSFRRVDIILKEGAKKAVARSIEEGERITIAEGSNFLPPTSSEAADEAEEQRFLDRVLKKHQKEQQ